MITRNLDKARDAFRKGSIEESKLAHENKKLLEEHNENGQYIKSLVYGAMDGIITTFAVVAGVVGAKLSMGVILILGIANLFADGLSMAIGDYLSTKAEVDYNNSERKREEWEVLHNPEGEKRELEELYISKGISKEDSEAITNIVSKYNKAWVDIMMVEELGIIENDDAPLKNALVTFFSFVIFGFVPVLGYIIGNNIEWLSSNVFLLDCILTGVTLMILGAIKGSISCKNKLISAVETLVVGGLAAGVAFAVGQILSTLA